MRLVKWMPILVGLVIAKLIITGSLVYLYQDRALFEPPSAIAQSDVEKPAPTSCPQELFTALRAERERIRQRQKELEKRTKQVALLEEQISRRLASLASLEDEIDKKLQKLQAIKNERFKLLVGAYANMKPSKAARLLEAMEPEMAIKILSSLKTDQVARILSSMPPEKAASLAESISGLPPREF